LKRGCCMNRRDLFKLVGTAVAWPFTAQAQQPLPVIGFLTGYADDAFSRQLMTDFLRGLAESGFVGGKDVEIEVRRADVHYDRLGGMAAELVSLNVRVIFASGTPAAVAAKAATMTIPIVFSLGSDPVVAGLVASLARPGGNITGTTRLSSELGPKRLELIREVVPTATKIALLVNPTNPAIANPDATTTEAAARALGMQLILLTASTEDEIEAAFAALVQQQASALVISADVFFNSRSDQFAALTLRHRIPSIHSYRGFAVDGGLMAYGGDLTDNYRTSGSYVGRILKGERPADLPVQQSSKVGLYINLKTAMALGLTIPTTLLFRATEVIE
jgi:putative tryptophan/tyrosine transport system substrate-binding protein